MQAAGQGFTRIFTTERYSADQKILLEDDIETDLAAVAEAARVGGLKAHQKDFANPESLVHGIRKKAPQAFFPLGRETHINFDRIAELATELKDRDVVLNTLADNLNNCIACHSAYRVEEAH